MGNKFCKLNNNYILTQDKSVASCFPDKEIESVKNGQSVTSAPGDVLSGKCMYFDSTGLRKLTTSPEFDKLANKDKEKQIANNLVDTGIRCVKTIGSRDGKQPASVTTTGTVPANMFGVSSNPSISQQDFDMMESTYIMGYMQGVTSDENFARYNESIDKAFNTSSMKKVSATTTASTTPSTTPATTAATTQATTAATPATITPLTPSPWMNWVFFALLVVFVIVIIAGIVMISTAGSNANTQYGGSKVLKKALKKMK